MMGKLGQMMGMGGGMPMPSPEEIAALQKQMGGAGAAPGLARGRRHSRRPAARRLQPAAAFPGLGGGKLPGLGGGFNPFGGKKK